MYDTYVTVTGWMGTDVTLREVSGGRAVAVFRVGSTPRRLRDDEWTNAPTTWHRVKAWDRLARHCAESLRSGDPVLLHGRLVTDTWNREDGSTLTRFEVVAMSVGHDLTHGTSRLTRATSRPGSTDAVDAPPAPTPKTVSTTRPSAPAAGEEAA